MSFDLEKVRDYLTFALRAMGESENDTTPSFSKTRWLIPVIIVNACGGTEHIKTKIALKPIGSDGFQCVFTRYSETLMMIEAYEFTPFAAFEKALDSIEENFKRYSEEYPCYLEALKDIELIPVTRMMQLYDEELKSINRLIEIEEKNV